jgi:tetratricopeptide (TPR) repeat protein
MQTKLSIFCDKVIEAGWLAAVIVVPLFFNVYSDRVFEPDKLTLLRSIALMMAVAWIIKVVEVGSWRLEVRSGALSLSKGWKSVLRTPLVLPTLLLAMVYVLATLASVTPRVSLWGSYVRLQGTYTTFSYMVIFFLALQGLRTREQIERVVTIAILVSLPISLYGILQHYGRDPLPWAADVTRRAAANMGNSIFVAAYLIMVVPLTLARVVESFSSILAEEEGATSNVVLATCYVFILAAQLICIFFTQSRGPLMGLLAGLFSFVLLSLIILRQRAEDQTSIKRSDVVKAIATAVLGIPTGFVIVIGSLVIFRKGRKWLWLAWIIQALGVLAFLIVFNLPGSPIASWRDLPYIGRLGRVFETETGTGLVRVLIWEGVLKMMTPHEPIQYPSGQPDQLNPLRPLIGYGPESMYVAYNRFYPPDLAHAESRRASPDRSHNETFDALVITGLVGFVVYMLLFGSVFYYGYRWLGLIENPRQRNVFVGLFLGGGLAAALFLWLWQGAQFVGVGLPLGIALGLAGYLVVSAIAFYRRPNLQPPISNLQPPTLRPGSGQASDFQFLLIALVSALLAHFVEIHFGIAIAATRTYFWVYTALMVAAGYYLGREPISLQTAEAVVPVEVPKQSRRRRRRSRQSQDQVPSESSSQAPRPSSVQAAQGRGASVIIYSLLAGLILVTMGYDYITPQFNIAAKGYSLLWLLALTWLLGGAIIVALTSRGQFRRNNWPLAPLLYSLISLGCFFIFFIIRIRQTHTGITVASVSDLLKQASVVAGGLVLYYVFVLLFLLAIASALMGGMSLPSSPWRRRYGWLYPLLVVGVAVLIFVTNLSVIRADIIYKHAKSYFEAGQLDAGIALYQQAIKLAPKEDYYYLFLGSAYLEKAEDVSNPAERAALLEESRKVLESALQLNPLNTDHSANLARLYHTWGKLVSDPAQRAEKLGKSLEYYRQATNLSPHHAHLFNEWGLVYVSLGDREKALEKYQHSLSLDQEYDQTYILLGDLYLKEKDLDKAADAYSKALEVNPRMWQAHVNLASIYIQQGRLQEAAEAYRMALDLNPSSVQAHSGLAYIYSQQGKLQEAVEENLEVLKLDPNDYVSHKNLALLYQKLERTDEAVAEAQIALGLAPEGDKRNLETFIAQLRPGQPITTSDDELIQTYLNEGQTYLNEKDFERAEEVYAKALELNPNIIQAHSALGYIYALQGKLQEALEENLKVLELAPNDYATHKNLAMIYQQLGRIEEAIAEAETALELAPESDRPALETFITQLRQQVSP